MADTRIEILDYIRTSGIIAVGLIVLLMRKRVFWSVLKLNEMGKHNKKALNKK